MSLASPDLISNRRKVPALDQSLPGKAPSLPLGGAKGVTSSEGTNTQGDVKKQSADSALGVVGLIAGILQPFALGSSPEIASRGAQKFAGLDLPKADEAKESARATKLSMKASKDWSERLSKELEQMATNSVMTRFSALGLQPRPMRLETSRLESKHTKSNA